MSTSKFKIRSSNLSHDYHKNQGNSDQGISDQGNSDQGNSDQGNSDQGNSNVIKCRI